MVVGALITMISSLASLVTQMAINYPVRDVLMQGGSAVAAVHALTNLGNSIHRRSRAALVLGTISNSFMAPLVTRATGNCTFNICLQMTSITSQLHIEKVENPALMSISLNK